MLYCLRFALLVLETRDLATLAFRIEAVIFRLLPIATVAQPILALVANSRHCGELKQ